MNLWLSAYLAATIFFLIGCGGNSSSQDSITSVISVPEFIIIKDDGVITNSASVSGSGSIVFTEPLGGNAAGFKVQLGLIDDDSSISFFVFSDSKLSESGAVVIKIQKKGGNLTGTLKISGSATIDLGLESLSDTEDTLYFDVHNDEEPSHILFWLDDTALFDVPSAIFNSQASAEVSSLGQKIGTGLFVGVKLENASLKSFEISAPRFED